MNEIVLNNLHELKGALEDLNNSYLLDARMTMLEMVDKCLEILEEEKNIIK